MISRKIKEKLSLGLNEIYIAATALVREEKVLTANIKDFEQVEELEVLDWKEFKKNNS